MHLTLIYDDKYRHNLSYSMHILLPFDCLYINMPVNDQDPYGVDSPSDWIWRRLDANDEYTDGEYLIEVEELSGQVKTEWRVKVSQSNTTIGGGRTNSDRTTYHPQSPAEVKARVEEIIGKIEAGQF